jgi:dienelactone hydrolase
MATRSSSSSGRRSGAFRHGMRARLLLLAALLPVPQLCLAAVNDACHDAAVRLLEAIKGEDFAGAVAHFSDAMRSQLPEGKLRGVMLDLTRKLGAIERFGEATSAEVDGNALVTIPVHFARGTLDSRTACGRDAKVVGFRLVPPRGPAARSDPSREPDYVRRESFEEKPVTVGPRALAGALTLPKGRSRFPAAVFIHGSGPGDMDASVGPNRPFRDLAWGLASEGIASLRYDKRTRAHPELFASGDYSLEDEVIEDARAAIGELRNASGVDPDRVYLIGHSLGARLAPSIAAREKLRGVVLLAAPASPLEDALRRQVLYLARADGEISAGEQHALDRLDASIANLRDLQRGRPVTGPLPLGLPARYWKDLSAQDPIEAAGAIALPVLVLQGERDYQVTMQHDYARWQQHFARSDRFTLRSYPDLNHLFQSGSAASTPAEYSQPGNMSGAVLRDIAGWIATH